MDNTQKFIHCRCGNVIIVRQDDRGELKIIGQMNEGVCCCPTMPDWFKNITKEEYDKFMKNLKELTKNHLYC
jgi:hypothetical protein